MPRNIAEAYLAGATGDVFPHHFADPASRRCAVQRAVRPVSRAVADVISKQNALLAPSAARDTNIAALRHGAAAVVSGQQVGLFLGPLFTLYKAASAIRVAQALAVESGQPVVPIFWLQTEDHDIAEIAVSHVPSGRGPVAIQMPFDAAGRVSVAHLQLDAPLTACCATLQETIAHLPHAIDHLDLLRRHYRPGAGWAQAFAGLIAELFAPEGLIVFDPRQPDVAELAVPVHRQALLEARTIASTLLERGRALTAAGFAPAIHVRDDAPLCFFHSGHASGARHRLQPTPDGFAEVGGSHTHVLENLTATLSTAPLRFSTSALLRPILQDQLLPTAAYVGGPGEIAYFAQLAPVYAAFGIEMPLIVPRARFRVIEPHTQRWLDRLRLTPAEVERPEDAILASVQGAEARLNSAALAQQLLTPFNAALDALRDPLEATGPGLDTAVAKTRATVANAVAKLAAKYEKALLHRADDVVEAVRNLHAHLWPNGEPQERIFGFSAFAARWGTRPFVERIVEAIQPFAPSIRDLTWPESTSTAAAASGRP